MPDDDLSTKLEASRKKLEAQRAAEAAAARPQPTLKRKSIHEGDAPKSPTVTVNREALTSEKPERKSKRSRDQVAAADTHRTPPHSVEAEMGVLSSIVVDAQFGSKAFTVLAEVASKITPHYFYVPAHKTIYETFLKMWRAGTSIDLITFTEYLRDHKLLDSVGGPSFVTSLISFVPTAANVAYYIDIMIAKMRRREAISDGTLLVRSSFASEDDESFLGQLQRVTNRLLTLSSTNGKFPQMVDAAEFCEESAALDLPPLVIHYLLHRASKMLLGGNSKGRKTWALMDLALSVASGVDWWGFHTHKGCVCYVNLELQPAFFQQRLTKIVEVKGCRPERGSFFVWNLRGYAKPMNELIKDLLIFLQQHLFSLIIIDPIYKTLPATHGAENDSAIITQLLNDVEAIAVETNAAVIFSSHFSKGDQSEKESVDRVSGSGAWARDPDSLLTMTAHEDADSFVCEATLRNLAPIRPFVVKWEYPLFVRQDDADASKLKKPAGKGRPVEHSESDVLAAMRDLSWRTSDLQKHLDKENGMSRANFYRMWDKLKKTEQIVEILEGDDAGKWRRSEGAAEPF